MEVAKSNLLSLEWSLARRSWGCLTEDSGLTIHHRDEACLSVRAWCWAGMEYRDSALTMKSRQHYVVYHDRDGQVPWTKWLTARCKARLSWRNLIQDDNLVTWARFFGFSLYVSLFDTRPSVAETSHIREFGNVKNHLGTFQGKHACLRELYLTPRGPQWPVVAASEWHRRKHIA